MRISDWSSDVCSSDLPAEADVADRSELRLDLIGVGAEAAARALHLIVRIAIAAGEAQVVDEAVVDDRNPHFGARLAHAERNADRKGRRALPGERKGVVEGKRESGGG